MHARVLRKIVAVFGVAIAIFIVVVLLQPGEFRIARSASISAPPSTLYDMLTDFHVWDAWSPWSKLDPEMTKTISGPAKGKGAVYEWSGNEKVGQGRMEITDTRENAEVVMALQFVTPFEANNVTTFTLAPDPKGTRVTWAMTGKNGFMSKMFGLFMDVDKMVGKQFEEGLANLQRLAEARAK